MRSQPPTAITVATPALEARGGIQTYLSDILASFSRQGIAFNHIEARLRPDYTRFGRALERLRMLAQVARARRETDVLVIGHLRFVELIVFGAMVRLPTKVLVYGRELDTFTRWYHIPLRMLNKSGRIDFLTISEATKQLAECHGYTTTSWRLLQPTITMKPIEPKHIADPSPDRQLRIVSTCRLERGSERKNIDALICAVHEARLKGLAVSLDIVGDGDLRQHLQGLSIALGIDESIRFHGSISDEHRDRLYGECDIFALPSTQEGFGIVVLEAWCHRLAVIGSDERALGELIHDELDGLTPKPNAKDLAEAILRLADHRFRQELSSRGAQRVEDEFGERAFDIAVCRTLRGAMNA